MKTSRRYLYRIVLPVVAVAFIAIAGNTAYRIFDGDPEPDHVEESMESQPPRYFDKIETRPFSQEMVTAEVQKLQRSLSTLDTAANSEVVADSDNIANLTALKRNVEDEIEALEDANQENWDERRQAAEDALSQYAAAVGRDAENQPQG